jgi:DNA polymerase-3 subunit alpha/error-prone DNA polymerase
MVIHSSIIRPAANDYIREYLRRLHGGGWNPIHPLLSDVLDETYGIMVYQEDVSRAAVSMAGFSHAEADGLRKVLSKKDRARRLRDYRERFFAGAAARGVAADKIAQVWEMMMSFDGYSFCKPHSASYARVSFQAAYLKVHHPAEFMAAVISNGGGFYSAFAYVSEARRLGVSVRPPEVNRSQDRWTGQEMTLRVGLMAVKGLSLETRQRIVDQRRPRPYRSLTDFLDRVRPDAAEARVLIRCGAMDPFSPDGNRAALMWVLARWEKSRQRGPVDGDLFGAAPDDVPPPLPPEDPRERLRREFAVLGFLCDRHPIGFWSDPSRKNGTIKAADLHRHVGKRATLCAWLITGKRVRTKHGETMEFLTFEDETGLVETTFFPKPYARFCHLLEPGRPFLISGKVETEWGAATVAVEGVEKPSTLHS